MPSLRRVARATVLVVVGGLALPVLAGPNFFTPHHRRPLAASEARRATAPIDEVVVERRVRRGQETRGITPVATHAADR
ncbi:MAG TPA: hypothetical protein VGD37_01245 [Kofleriaceae bacterium]|jgi:hypothetical protein